MTDEIWKRDEIDSPCVKICVVHQDSKLCIGCRRTMDEIRDWSHMTAERRTELMVELPARDLQLRRARRGRAARLENR